MDKKRIFSASVYVCLCLVWRKTHREGFSDIPGGDSGDQQGEDADDDSVVPQALTLLWALMHATKESTDASLVQADHVNAKSDVPSVDRHWIHTRKHRTTSGSDWDGCSWYGVRMFRGQ